VGSGQGLDPPRAQVGELESHDSLVMLVIDALHQSSADGAVDELDDAVVPEQEVLGDFPDRRRRAMPADREQELVLGAGEPDGLGLRFAPVLEPAQPVAEIQQPAEVLVTKLRGSPSHIGSR
jgi:hypothetical protein